MDADTRHQLKQNEFAEALGKLRDFSDKRTIGWIVVIILIAVGYAGMKFWNWRSQERLAQNCRAVLAIQTNDPSLGDAPLAQLRQIISDSSGTEAEALARLKLAEGLQTRGVGADGAASLDKAEQEFTNLLNNASASGHIRAIACFRLAALYETKRDFARAEEMYRKLTGESPFAGSPYQELASFRVDMLDELAEPVRFTPGVRPLPPVGPPAADDESAATDEPDSEEPIDEPANDDESSDEQAPPIDAPQSDDPPRP